MGELLLQRLSTQRDALRSAGEASRRGDPEGVHDLRVAIRRIRSALATFRPLVDESVTEPVRAQLRWAADELGQARDAEIVVDRVRRWLDVGPGLTGGKDAERLLFADVEQARHLAHAQVGAVLSAPRYAATLAAVDRIVVDPPLTDEAGRPARDVATAYVRRDAHRLWRAVARASAEQDPDARAPLLHEVRKAAKRLRYAAEAASAYADVDLEAVADAAADIQTTLGDHHDAVVTMSAVRAIATSHGDAAVALCGGQVIALEAVDAARLEDDAAAALARLELLTDW